MTLLVINVAIPAHLDDAAFHKALRDALPNLGAFALSFTLIAGFWRDHRRILTALPTETAVVTRLILIGLGLVALLPFPTTLLAEYASQPETVALYAGAMATIHAVHVTLLLLTQHQVHPSPASSAAVARRRFTAQLGSSRSDLRPLRSPGLHQHGSGDVVLAHAHPRALLPRPPPPPRSAPVGADTLICPASAPASPTPSARRVPSGWSRPTSR